MYSFLIFCLLMGVFTAIWLPNRLLTNKAERTPQNIFEIAICGFILGFFIIVSFPMLLAIVIKRK